MRIIVLDFHGTLTPLPDPVAFVRALQAQGDFVILWSGSPHWEIEKVVPGLLAVVNCVAEKPDMPDKMIDATGVECDEVIVVDDHPILGHAAVRFGRVRPEMWRYVPAEDIISLQRP
tara:strand:- start:2414 stop:2764 length:351 start_codon:yes stop_codon:yes gene_type:complete